MFNNVDFGRNEVLCASPASYVFRMIYFSLLEVKLVSILKEEKPRLN